MAEGFSREPRQAADQTDLTADPGLARWIKILTITIMKLALAVLVYLLIGVILGAGILLAVAGKPWFLIAAFIVYVVAFGKIGCMTH
jgi:hypothetical protein